MDLYKGKFASVENGKDCENYNYTLIVYCYCYMERLSGLA